MELTRTESAVIEAYRIAKRDNDTNRIISLYAFMEMISKDKGPLQQSNLLIGFTRGQYKRAIKFLRVTQASALRGNEPSTAEIYDRTIRYIREYYLNRSKEIA